jgi:hypothetical protein
VKLKRYGAASLRPLTAVAPASTVTSNFVACGSGFDRSGVKIRTVVPDQRYSPAIAGRIRTNGTRTGCGILPSSTIGSEKTIRISFT